MTKKIITIFILLTTGIGYGQSSDVVSPGKIALGINIGLYYKLK